MNKQQLANKIWESANRMRSKIEANEYKDYILGFIFYKFLSDKEVSFLKKDGYEDADIQEHSEFDGHQPEEFLRIPIGLSLLMDENLTVEEAIRLHTHAIEYDFIATAADKNIAPVGYQVTVYGTGDVVHILAENPTTGQNTYSVMTRLYMDNATQIGKLVYAHLAQYLDD